MGTPWVVITGAGTGIGRALAMAFAKKGHNTLAIGRRLQPLESLIRADPTNNISIVSADVSSPSGRRTINDALPKGDNIKFLIHNAGVLQPIKPLMELNENEFHDHISINLQGPLFLTKTLLGRLSTPKSMGASDTCPRILHLSSRGVLDPYPGCGIYCTSKTALNMIYRVLDLELKESHGIRVGSVRPGAVDTIMQEQLRNSEEGVFFARETFLKIKENNQLLSPSTVAKFIYWLLTETTPDEYAATEWNVTDKSHHHRWNL